MKYFSTRGDTQKLSAGEAILRGIAPDGGLYVPESIPLAEFSLDGLPDMSYNELAYEILKLYLTDYTRAELEACIASAYNPETFDTPLIAPVKSAAGTHFMELYHGRTLAFKDAALSILPHLMKTAARKYLGEKQIVILTATSGDTGKAALAGFADVEGVKIIVFYPERGVSAVQRRQMTTQEGGNTFVIGVNGNFDDTQTGVKRIFTDEAFKQELAARGYVFSSANSINIGRLLPQLIYYFHGYGQLVGSGVITAGDRLSFTVPTGNFGNILAGWYAGRMGLPVGKLICASNDNKVLYDFFRTGSYDINREFFVTSSPSMDILISSNLERLVYYATGSASETRGLMESLNKTGVYKLIAGIGDINAQYATGAEVAGAIKEVYNQGYTVDTHTAVAYAAYRKYLAETADAEQNIVLSTASPFKFARDVCGAIDPKLGGRDAFALLPELAALTGCEVPAQLIDIDKKEVRHTASCEKEDMKRAVEKILF